MALELTDADKRKLAGVDPRLVNVIEKLAKRSPVPFMVTEGVRTLARQHELYAQKKTKTLKSKHLTGRAVDIVPLVAGKPVWSWKLYTPLIKAAKEIAVAEGLRMQFGYDWGWDAPHLELDDDR